MSTYDKIIEMYCLTGKMPTNLLAEVCIDAHRQIYAEVEVTKVEVDRRQEFNHQWLNLVQEWAKMGNLEQSC